MNPHDATKRPDAHLVFEVLAIEDPESLVTLHPSRSPLSMLATLVADSSRDTDRLHSALLERAETAIKTLERLTRAPGGDLRDSSGVLRSTGGEIEVLAARRGQAFEHLTRAVHSYERCRPGPVNTPTATTPEQTLVHQQDGARQSSTAWTPPEDQQLKVLLATGQGSLRLHQSALHPADRYFSDGTGDYVFIWPATVDWMQAEGLISIDTSTTVYEGQLLFLTPRGADALHAKADATALVAAALSRSRHAPAPAAMTAPAAVPAPAATPGKPARSH
ncbi:hypothetical protein AB0K51_01905 [Kitasatospora sp. NPDC049285]|uniref:hypothetical protein n=1 Tax=Kitasatospora sp. NPDC049285 TaxID=3157096 RepID=UPI00341C2FEB